jgi:anhydro-N-acetylmuramic acid kinase
MACGGQGAPLVPAFHAWCFGRAAESCAIVNIGGIANITALAPGRPPLGFDTGPGNTLLDLWIRHCRGKPFDRNGDWAATGTVDRSLLNSFLAEPYLAAPPPKSTGREMFHMAWLEQRLARCEPTEPADVQATLAELTASTIATAIERTLGSGPRVIVCGGGAYNSDLMRRLGRLTGASVETTAAFGIAPDWVEGAAFAWLARERLRLAAGNVPSVTGSRRAAVLGGIYWGGTPKSL